MVSLLFELIRKDVAFVWDVGCQQAYQALKAALVDALVLTRPDFRRTFWLDVDWSPRVLELYCHRKKAGLRRW